MREDLCFLDASELAARVRARELSPLEVVRGHLERIDAVNPKINAIVTRIADAEDRARAAEAAVMRGDALGPLHGVPFTVKDCLDTAAVRTTRGSRLYADRVATADATVVTRLRAAGAIMIGKTNLSEFALWWETSNLLFGRTVNPWNAERTAGGSSGGEAAAVAAGLSPLGVGSDVGGSVRGPAHHCGVVGLKATHGRIPLTGHWPETLFRFMHVGPLARSVRDAALALSVMAGPDGRDWYAMPVPLTDPPASDAPLPRLRIGWMAEHGFGRIASDVVATVADAAEALRASGCTVDPVRLPELENRPWHLLSGTLFGAEAGPYFAPIIAGREAELHPFVRRRLSQRVESLPDYMDAHAAMEALRQDVASCFTRHDVLLCPTFPVPAHPHDQDEAVIEGEVFPLRQLVRATVPFNLTGSPALTVPFGWSREGLPIGVQVVGRHFDEATVLRVGMALETIHMPRRRRPQV